MRRSEIEKFFSDDDDFLGGNTQLVAGDDSDGWGSEDDDLEGQLSIDMYQTNNDVVVKAPVAGVDPDNIDISVTEDFVTIKGHRKEEHKHEENDYLVKECYWGSFSRTQSLPVPVLADKAEASISKKGILTIRIPKSNKGKSKSLKVKVE